MLQQWAADACGPLRLREEGALVQAELGRTTTGRRANRSGFSRLAESLWKGRTGYLFIAVPMVSLGLFVFYPLLSAMWLSLHDYNGIKQPRWVGLDNYVGLLQEATFRRAMGNTVLFAVESLVLGVGIALIAALVIHRCTWGRGFFRAAFFLPVVTNMVAVSMLWKLIYQETGILSGLLSLVGVAPRAWLNSPGTALHAVVLMSVWQGFGYSLIVFLAALGAIPKEYYEAARVDGANGLQEFWNITLPGLRYPMLFLSITGVAGALMVFTQVYVMTSGGPVDSTRTVMYDLFLRFTRLKLGEANAVGVMVFVFLLLFSLVNLRLIARTEK